MPTINFMVPFEGRVASLNALRETLLDGSEIVLFENDIDPGDGVTLGDLVEPSWAGYERKALVGWTDPALNDDGVALTSADAVTWTKTDAGDANLVGYGLIDSEGTLIGIQRFLEIGAIVLAQLVPFPLVVTYGDTSEF